MKQLVTLLLFLSILFCLGNSARILGIFPAPGYRQFLLGRKLMLELAARGHQVTVIAPYKPENPPNNYETVYTGDILNNFTDYNPFNVETLDIFNNVMRTYGLGYRVSSMTLNHPEVRKLINSDRQFDLVINEQFFDESLNGFAPHFEAPLILFSSLGTCEWNNHIMGNPSLPAISPLSKLPYSSNMNFTDRLINLFLRIFDHFYREYVAYPRHEELLKNHFNLDQNLRQVYENTSLMLVNSHVTTWGSTNLVHGMVEIGGFHIEQHPLEPKVKKFLDGATDGAIYLSFGTNLKMTNLKPEQLRIFLNVLAKLKQRVVWKHEEDKIEGLPKNVFVSKWFNQSDVLGHENMQLFITHGGLISITEAVFYGVPLIGLPIFGDQPMNMARAEEHGFAKILHLKDLTEAMLNEAITEVLTNSKYQETARKLSNYMRDNVVRPLDLAMYWIEFVLRHKGVHFKAPGLRLEWYQMYPLDVIITYKILIIIAYLIIRILPRKKSKYPDPTKKSNKKVKKN